MKTKELFMFVPVLQPNIEVGLFMYSFMYTNCPLGRRLGGSWNLSVLGENPDAWTNVSIITDVHEYRL
jgi:hypothetical protein